jgi:neurotransmitter:Na+ symporter, NSS family
MTQQREHWGSRIGFIFAAAGSAIGLGSLWKFPYVTGQNGGGAFVLVYLLAMFLICVPLFIAELVIGRTSQRGPVGAFAELSHQSRNWKLVGWLAVLSTFIVYSYYSVVAGWTLNYALLSLGNFTRGLTDGQISEIFNVLLVSGDINVFWHFLFVLLTVGVVYKGVREGIEHWARILTPALIILLVCLFFYSMTLDGFGEACRFVLYPHTDQLTASGILTAVGLAFFTSSLGFGVILTYGSYMNAKEDIPKTALIVEIMTVLISLIAAMMIFPIIFTGNTAPAEGPGLVFKVLPVLFAHLPGTLVISTTFFVLLVFTALTSTISLQENLVANCIELFGWSRRKSALITGGAVFLMGIPSALAASGGIFPSWTLMYGENFFETVNSIWDAWFLPISGLLTSIFVGWIFPRERRWQEFMRGTGWGKIYGVWLTLVRWVVPLMLIILLMQATGFINVDRWL